MDWQPDSDPPHPQLPPQGTAPMFPLPGAYLFPHQVLPLHIFEPRYKQMIEDSLDGPGRIVIAPIPADAVDGDRPRPVRPIGGLGEIARHDKLPDGRFAIMVLGLQRVSIDEIPSERPYRQARWTAVPDLDPDPAEAESLRQALREAASSKTKGSVELPDEVSAAVLSDLLVQTLQVDDDERASLFCETDVEARSRRALAWFDAGR